MTEAETKNLLGRYEFLLVCFLGTALLLFLLCLAARSSWISGLKSQTEAVLDTAAPGQYVLGDFVRYDSPFSLNAAAFTIAAFQGRAAAGVYAVIARVVTMYGPAVCVFILENNAARFVGFAGTPRRIEGQFDSPMVFSQIAHWEKKLPSMPLVSPESP
jgi:hypothetical protein